MERRNFLTAMLGLAVPAAIVPLVPEAEAATSWRYLGTRRASVIADHDRIWVGPGSGTFRKIRLTVSGNALWIYDLDVRFHNGGHQDVGVRLRIPQGGATRAIDLQGADRHIRYVDFNYGHMPNFRGKAFVSLWGQV